MSENVVKKHKYKILIIGAGAAGLSAANHLIKNGIEDFLILEARNRIGGRIISIDVGSQKVELGANWIHGVLGNPIFELAMAHNLINIINIPKPHKVIASMENGKQVNFSVLQEIYEAYICFLKRCEEYFLCQYLPPDNIYSVGEHINLEIDLYLKNLSDSKDRHIRKLIFECLLKRETCITGCSSMNEIDLLELGSYTELQGGNIVLNSGYSSILNPLTSTLPQESIVLNCPVKTIRWKRKKTSAPDKLGQIPEEEEEEESDDGNDSDKTITDEPITKSLNEGNVEVICDNGEMYYADHLICTIPLGCLKDYPKLFEPKLPEYKLESIRSLLFGTVDKILLEYDRPFLNSDISEIMLLWEPDCDTNAGASASTSSGDSLDPESDEYIQIFWYKKIYSFSKVSDKILLGWISGREAEYMETLEQTIIADKCTEILRKFLKDPFIPKPKNCICTSWKNQPYSRGSYTSIAVGACQEDIENIAQPLYSNPHQSKPSVLFAGEHTHLNFYSTVHGAYLSGRTAAQIITTPDSPQEIVMESDSSDISEWINGIALD